ncbi:MAG: hypothetical protein V4688_06715 [Pseudomonadota bacterium]
MKLVRGFGISLLASALIACGDGPSPAPTTPAGSNDPAPAAASLPLIGSLVSAGADDPACGTYPDASAEFAACELKNYARVSEAPREEATNPIFLQRFAEQSLANFQSYFERLASDPSYLPVSTGGVPLNTPVTPVCATWGLQCVGDPFRYPGFDPFYEREAVVEPVTYYDRDCARISGRVWRPKNTTGPLPTVVIENGSVQAPEPLYWWMAQALVRSGYAVMTFDPRGQGRSDQQTPMGGQGSNINSAVFWEGLVDAIDFFRSTSARPYPHNTSCAGTYPTVVTAFNPQHAVQDRERLGIVGHSLGATGVSIVQGYGGVGADPWPGKMDAANPVDVAVAWDGLLAPDSGAAGGLSAVTALAGQGSAYPKFAPRVPSMGQNSEYGLTPMPFTQTPPKDGNLGPFKAWQSAGVPVFEFTIRGSSHYEWSLLPTFPATSWCPEVKDGRCVGGWGRPMAEHYSLAWLDRWLKRDGETGFADADARLLAEAEFLPRFSFYSQSARDFPTRNGRRAQCADMLAGCP